MDPSFVQPSTSVGVIRYNGSGPSNEHSSGSTISHSTNSTFGGSNASNTYMGHPSYLNMGSPYSEPSTGIGSPTMVNNSSVNGNRGGSRSFSESTVNSQFKRSDSTHHLPLPPPSPQHYRPNLEYSVHSPQPRYPDQGNLSYSQQADSTRRPEYSTPSPVFKGPEVKKRKYTKRKNKEAENNEQDVSIKTEEASEFDEMESLEPETQQEIAFWKMVDEMKENIRRKQANEPEKRPTQSPNIQVNFQPQHPSILMQELQLGQQSQQQNNVSAQHQQSYYFSHLELSQLQQNNPHVQPFPTQEHLGLPPPLPFHPPSQLHTQPIYHFSSPSAVPSTVQSSILHSGQFLPQNGQFQQQSSQQTSSSSTTINENNGNSSSDGSRSTPETRDEVPKVVPQPEQLRPIDPDRWDDVLDLDSLC